MQSQSYTYHRVISRVYLAYISLKTGAGGFFPWQLGVILMIGWFRLLERRMGRDRHRCQSSSLHETLQTSRNSTLLMMNFCNISILSTGSWNSSFNKAKFKLGTQVFQFFFKPSIYILPSRFFLWRKTQIFQTINQRDRTFPSGRNEQRNVFYPYLWHAHIVHVWDLPPWAPLCWASLLSSWATWRNKKWAKVEGNWNSPSFKWVVVLGFVLKFWVIVICIVERRFSTWIWGCQLGAWNIWNGAAVECLETYGSWRLLKCDWFIAQTYQWSCQVKSLKASVFLDSYVSFFNPPEAWMILNDDYTP